MVKYLFVFLFGVIVLTSCNQQSQVYESADLTLHSSNLIEKLATPEIKVQDERIYTIETNMYSFVGVYDWFDNDTILYLTDENGVSIVHKLNIVTGDHENFFQIDDPIIRVVSSPDHSFFVIEVSTFKGTRELLFVNKSGEILYTLHDIGEEVQFYWDSFKDHQLIIAALQTDYTIEMYHIDLANKKTAEFEFDYYYVQWVNDNELAYLKWDMLAPSYYAPLFKYNLETEKESKLADEVIAFFSFHHYLLTVSIEGGYVSESNYLIFDTKTGKRLASFQVPILHTYSEQWWLPNHAVDLNNGSFYYFQPNSSGDLFQYSDGYSLVSFKVETGEKVELITSDENYPMKISPDGRWLLYGYQLENIVNLKKKEITSLVYW